ncbi:MAG TPA: Ig-like domain-containing protein [Gaiellaceae bacterium]|nr:Ig-like domain-containing protein [Gaiellaceae bacterium]
MLHLPRAAVAATVALIVAGTISVAAAAAAPPGHAAGSGAVADGWTFDFDATGDDTAGGAAGTMTLSLPSSGETATADVDCLSLRGSEAVVSGRIVSSNFTSYPDDMDWTGLQLVFFADDEGSGGDAWTYWLNEGQEQSCASLVLQPTSPLSSGWLTVGAVQPASLDLAVQTPGRVVGIQACATAAVRDTRSNPLAGVAVDFAVTGANAAADEVETVADGTASFCYVGTRAGTDTVTATAQGGSEPSATATVSYAPGEPATVSLTPREQTVLAGTQSCVTARDTDAYGNPLGNRGIYFAVNGSVVAVRATAADGTASDCFTGEYVGDATVTATDLHSPRQPSGSAIVHLEPGPPTFVFLTPPAATATAGSRVCLHASVSGLVGNPEAGYTVDFSVAGANAASGSGRTGSSGEADFCYTGTHAGVDTVTATVEGGTNPAATATQTYTAGSPAALSLTPATVEAAPGNEVCVTAAVADEFGNGVADAAVEFAVAGSDSGGGTVSTGADGAAAYCFAATPFGGADTVTATADAGSQPSDTAQVTVSVPPSTPGCTVRGAGTVLVDGRRVPFQVRDDSLRYLDRKGHGVVESTSVASVVCSGPAATIYGAATLDGAGSYAFRLDVSGDRLRIRLADGFDSGELAIAGGKVQVDD